MNVKKHNITKEMLMEFDEMELRKLARVLGVQAKGKEELQKEIAIKLGL